MEVTIRVIRLKKRLPNERLSLRIEKRLGDVTQSGRVPQWHCGSRGFESLHLHHKKDPVVDTMTGSLFCLLRARKACLIVFVALFGVIKEDGVSYM